MAANLTSVQNNGLSLIQGWVDGNFASKWSQARAWVCFAYAPKGSPRSCTMELAKGFVSNWTLQMWEAPVPQTVAVDYCLVGRELNSQERCGLHFSPPIMGIVALCTLLGGLLILWTTICHREPTMVTLGDAIASFLDFPADSTAHEEDPESYTAEGVKSGYSWVCSNKTAVRTMEWIPVPSVSWLRAASISTWIWSSIVLVSPLAIRSDSLA